MVFIDGVKISRFFRITLMPTHSAIVQKLWNYCNILRDAGLSYGDYPSAWLRTSSEQLTFLLFLKMADERNSPTWKTGRKGAKYTDSWM